MRGPLTWVRHYRAFACIPSSRAPKVFTPVLFLLQNGTTSTTLAGKGRFRSTFQGGGWRSPQLAVQASCDVSSSCCIANAAVRHFSGGSEPAGARKSRARTKWRNCCPMKPTQSVCRINRLQSASKSSATKITQLSGRRTTTPGQKAIPTTTRPGYRSGWIPSAASCIDKTLTIRTGNRVICSSARAGRKFED